MMRIHYSILQLTISVCLLLLVGITPVGGQSQQLMIGINYEPLPRGAAFDEAVIEAQIYLDINMLAEKFRTIRIYQIQNIGERIIRIANEHRVDVVIQAWLIGESVNDDAEVSAAIRVANDYPNIAGVLVGSRVLSNNVLSLERLVEHIERVRQGIPAGIPVGYSDVFTQWVQNPALASEVDWVGLDSYGFLSCQSADQAVQYSINQWALLVGNPAFSNKRIMISETGWPTGGALGDCVNQDSPISAEQAQFVSTMVETAVAAELDIFLFEFADSDWRCTSNDSLEYACHWGLVNPDRSPKDAWNVLPQIPRVVELLPLLGVVKSDNRNAANCRVEPGLEQSVLTLVPNGESISILDRRSAEEWVLVRYNETECWIHHSLLLLDGRPVPTASQALAVTTADLEQFVESANGSICSGATPGEIANQTWGAPDVNVTAACVNSLQVWMPDVVRQQSELLTAGLCDMQPPSAVESETQQRFQTIWALDNAAIAYYNLGQELRDAGEFNLAQQAFLIITQDLSCAWAYDAVSADTPYFWSVSDEAQEHLESLPVSSGSKSG